MEGLLRRRSRRRSCHCPLSRPLAHLPLRETQAELMLMALIVLGGLR